MRILKGEEWYNDQVFALHWIDLNQTIRKMLAEKMTAKKHSTQQHLKECREGALQVKWVTYKCTPSEISE